MSEGIKYLTVSALTKYIRYKFDNDIHLESVYLEGEISNFKHHSRGHFYFTLKDQSAQISATMFYSEAQKVLFTPEDGMTVLVKGNVTVYETQGIYHINVHEMEQKGVGALFLAYEKLKKDLEKEGFFDPLHKKPIPLYPKSIGVITSPTGAAVRDCINTITRRFPIATIYIYPSLVQGEDAKNSIANNIKLANKQKLVDVLIVGRGGGSIEDLWAFNERMVAEAIYQSEIPIISGVGHETDFTISDFVADKRAATPTAAAELATPKLETIFANIDANVLLLKKSINEKIRSFSDRLLYLDSRLEATKPINKLKQMKDQIDNYNHLIKLYFEANVNNKMHQYNLLNEKLAILNPLKIMSKGFSVVSKNGVIIRSKNDVKANDLISISFSDGSINAKVMKEN